MNANAKMVAASFIFAVFMISSVAFAVPGYPVQFYGTASINGAAAPDGTTVTAQIDGSDVASAAVAGGSYNLIVSDPENTRSGSVISFFVNGLGTGKTGIFTQGASIPLNLAVTVEEPPPSSGGGSSGGGGGGGYIPPATTTTAANTSNTTTPEPVLISEEPTECTERWLCSDWTSCSAGLQNRTCEDVNKCGSELYRPLESQPCSTINPAPPLTAFAIDDPTTVGGIVVAVVVIVAILYYVFKSRGRKKIAKPAIKGKK